MSREIELYSEYYLLKLHEYLNMISALYVKIIVWIRFIIELFIIRNFVISDN